MSAENAFVLEGDLGAAEIADIYRRSLPDCRAGRFPERIDLSRLGQTDSSVLALMLEWQSRARAHDSAIEFQSPPRSLEVLAGLSQASDLLGWEKDQGESAQGGTE
jgi:ABC-type transporter Mla MlaB component